MKKIIVLFLLPSFVSAQSINGIAFSALASNNNSFQPIAGAPYGVHLSNANGSLTIAAEYGENTINESGLVTEASEPEISSSWPVYPSPTSDVLNLKITEQANVRLYGSNGQLLTELETKGSALTINMATYATGHYLLQVETSSKRKTYRIIKE